MLRIFLHSAIATFIFYMAASANESSWSHIDTLGATFFVAIATIGAGMNGRRGAP